MAVVKSPDKAALELAWAAGFFDGEGCISTSNKKYLRISIPQADPRPLLRFQAAVGVGKIRGPLRPPSFKPSYKSLWRYHVYRASDIEFVLEQLWPYLSEPKKKQALRVFEAVA
jgi:LAGLIDADG-like domain